MSSVNNPASFSYTPTDLMKALDVDKKGYVTEEDIADYRENYKLTKKSTALLNAIDGANFNDIAMNDGRSSGISLIDFKALAARGGNLNKVEQVDIDRLNRPAPNENTDSNDTPVSYAYSTNNVMMALDKNKDKKITPQEIFAYKQKQSLTPNHSNLLSKLLMQMPVSMELNGPPPKPLTLKDLQRFAAKSGNKNKLEPRDLP